MTGNEKKRAREVCSESSIKQVGKRKTGRAYRRYMRRQKDTQRRRIVALGGYDPRVGYLDYSKVDGEWLPNGTHIKYPKNSNCQRWIKCQTSSRVRKSLDYPSKGNFHHKLFDYWWTLY